MRVLQIANGYLGNKLYRNLFAVQAQKNIENTVYVPLRKGKAWLENAPDNVIFSNCFTQFDRLMFFSKQRKMLRDLKKLDPASFDFSHAHTVFSGGYAAYRLFQEYGLPYIVAVRNTDVNVFFKYMVHLRKIGVEILKHAENIIFLSPAYRDRVLERYIPAKDREVIRKKSLVIPNGISSLFFENLGTSKSISDKEKIRLIYVGEVNSNKNTELTIEAVDQLRAEGLPVELKVVGPVKERKYFDLMRKTDFLEYCERCPLEEVLKHLQSADIFVMPSHKETFGLVYAEAMSQGLPILYTRGQGFDGHFEEGVVGYSVSDRDAEELANKIKEIIQNYETLSENCIRLVGKFDLKTISEQYDKIYRRLKGE